MNLSKFILEVRTQNSNILNRIPKFYFLNFKDVLQKNGSEFHGKLLRIETNLLVAPDDIVVVLDGF